MRPYVLGVGGGGRGRAQGLQSREETGREGLNNISSHKQAIERHKENGQRMAGGPKKTHDQEGLREAMNR